MVFSKSLFWISKLPCIVIIWGHYLNNYILSASGTGHCLSTHHCLPSGIQKNSNMVDVQLLYAKSISDLHLEFLPGSNPFFFPTAHSLFCPLFLVLVVTAFWIFWNLFLLSPLLRSLIKKVSPFQSHAVPSLIMFMWTARLLRGPGSSVLILCNSYINAKVILAYL